MSSSELIKYIEQPGLLDESSIIDITLLAEKYPYFQTLQLLRIKNLHNIAPGTVKQALNYTAAYVTDRKILYYLLHPITREEKLPDEQVPDNNIKNTRAVEKQVKDTIRENIADTLSIQKNYIETNDDDEIEFSTSMDIKKEYGDGIELEEFVVRINKNDSDYIELIEDDITDNIPVEKEKDQTERIDEKIKETPRKEEDILTIITKGIIPDDIKDVHSKLSDSQKKKNALIDNFIKINPKIEPNKQPESNAYDISADSVQENEHLITDTLANIYLKQGHYAKAIFAYEKLSLKYPEKSAYFAGQIAEIKKLIEKNKE